MLSEIEIQQLIDDRDEAKRLLGEIGTCLLLASTSSFLWRKMTELGPEIDRLADYSKVSVFGEPEQLTIEDIEGL